MRILVHDFGGYAFALQLSRALAARGHLVCHAYCASHQTTPPGVEVGANGSIQLRPLHLSRPLNKYALTERWCQEREYGRLITDACVAFKPTVVLSGNTPISAQHRLWKVCHARSVPVIYWLQDLIGEATYRLLGKRMGPVGSVVGRYFRGAEGRLLRRSDAVIAVSDDFVARVEAMGVKKGRIHVIENWAPPLGPTTSTTPPLAETLMESPSLLYSGTLSLKHNPALLLHLAESVKGRAKVVVVSQGAGAEWLTEQKARRGVSSLSILPYQPKEDLPAMYAAATVLVAVLEEDASVFSVPSKVLTYLRAGKPLLLAVPADNLAARIVISAGAGRVVSPRDQAGFVKAAMELLKDAPGRVRMGKAATAYAEETFCIDRIADRFLAVASRVTQ